MWVGAGARGWDDAGAEEPRQGLGRSGSARGGQGGTTLVERDYLASWALLMSLGGAGSLPEGPGRPEAAAAAAAEAAEAAGLLWLRVLRRERQLQDAAEPRGRACP